MPTKKNLADLQKVAKGRGGECLSDAYIHIHSKYKWRCSKGHTWAATGNSVLRGTWCPVCAGRLENPLAALHAAATAKGGECLSEVYRGTEHKYKWRCARGHEWEARGSHVMRTSWCPICAGRFENPLETLHAMARKKGGECLTDVYLGIRRRYKWRCAKGHEWVTTGTHIRSGTWCPRCSGRVLENPLAELQQIAKERGGECLSTEYKSSTKKLRFRCAKGHEWEAVPDSVKNQGTWCQRCADEDLSKRFRLQNGLTVLQELANARGGECLSSEYINSQTKYRWRCANGHEWEANAQKVRTETWCPICTSGLRERLCREYLQILTGYSWPKVRPSWLKNVRGNQMELDGYCKELSVAFEHHGQQHYYQVDLFHRTQTLEQRKADDAFRRSLCREHDVRLIEIPYSVPADQLPEWLHTRLSKWVSSHTLIPWQNLNHNLTVLPDTSLKELGAFASNHGGELLDHVYMGVHGKLRFRCAKGHEWKAIPLNIKRGHWCQKCGADRRGLTQRLVDGLEQLKAHASKMGGVCLSTEYILSTSKYRFRCSLGHEWEMNLSGVKRGTWCPQCKGSRISQSRRDKHGLSTLKELAIAKGGVCLSTEYINVNTKYSWRCAKGHEWESTASNVKSGSWCHQCMGSRISASLIDPFGLAKLKEAAEAKGGECLSTEYIKLLSKYRWRCAKGHEWEAIGANVGRGRSWCPICARSKRSRSSK